MVETYTGHFVDLRDPDPQSIDPGDITHALSLLCRYGGHVRNFYSVAEHSVLVADLLDRQGHENLVLAGLLHDAAEAYLGDITRPLKLALTDGGMDFDTYGRLTALMETAIGSRFGFDETLFHDPRVKYADDWALAIEARALMATGGEHWNWTERFPEPPKSLVWICGQAPDHAAANMRRRWDEVCAP